MVDPLKSLPNEDLNSIANKVRSLDINLSGSTFILLGPTGFIGRWLVETLNILITRLNYDIEVICPSLDMNKANRIEDLVTPDNFLFEKIVDFDWSRRRYRDRTFVIHGFTPTDTKNEISANLRKLILKTTRASLKLIESYPLGGLVHLSSGGIFGATPRISGIPISSSASAAKQSDLNEYSKTKLIIENELRNAVNNGSRNVFNARIFTLYGPGMNLNAKFAICNIVQSVATRNSTTTINNANTFRSYLYPTDLVIGILSSLYSNVNKSINIGSIIQTKITDLASTIFSVWDYQPPLIDIKESDLDFYLPDDVYNEQSIDLLNGLEKWKEWLEDRKN